MAPASDVFDGEPEGTREAIMRATYEALCEHGYADLTIQRISDEFGKSKSLLYHHYESKDALLIDFMGFMLERTEADVPLSEQDDAHARLLVGFNYVFDDLLGDPEAFTRAIMELRVQAAHDGAYRGRVEKNDQFLIDRIAETVAAGVETGVFREVDPDRVAEYVLTILQGAMLRQATTDDPDLGAIRVELEEYVRLRLLAE